MKQELKKTASTAAKNRKVWLWFVLLSGFVLVFSAATTVVGASDISLKTVWEAIVRFDPLNRQHLVVRDLRFPRAILSALVGAAFAVSGAVMQGATRNPLADSGLLGLNAGAGFALSVSFAFFPAMGFARQALFAFGGAAFGALLVSAASLAGKGGSSPMRLVLAGAAVSALLTALSQGIALYFGVVRSTTFWTVGGVANAGWGQVKVVAPVIAAALLAAVCLSGQVSLLNLGEESAKGLGVNTVLARFAASLVVLVLAGTSVSVVGSVGFVGLVVAHAARFLVGADYRKIIPFSAVMGAFLMVAADLGARTLNPPFETPLGAVVSLIGVPFFLYLASRQRRAG